MNRKLIFRKAAKEDILAIIRLVWNDNLRKQDRKPPTMEIDAYDDYFNKIIMDDNQFLLVVEEEDQNIIATAHLTCLHYLPFFDKRVLVEYVRVDADYKGQGIGRQMFQWIEAKSREWQANMIQLTTDARRDDAQSFYTSLGYKPTHVGMKFKLK